MALICCICWVLLTLHLFTCTGQEISGYNGDEVICSQGLSNCTMTEVMEPLAQSVGVEVRSITAHFNVCSKSCLLYLFIDTQLGVHENNGEHDGSSGPDQECEACMAVCYHTPYTLPSCKEVGFTVIPRAFAQQSLAKISVVITNSGVSFNSQVYVFPVGFKQFKQEVVVPSLEEVCHHDEKKCVEECRVPELRTQDLFSEGMDFVELRFNGSNNGLIAVCVQYEPNGSCQRLNKMTIPIHSVAPCMCLMAWYEQKSRRSKICPFKNMDSFKRTLWENMTVSVRRGQRMGQSGDYVKMLLWNVSAPCRLEGEVWPCLKGSGCREMEGFRQQLSVGTWTQNSNSKLWTKAGVFENISPRLPCVMVKLNGWDHELGPFCLSNTDRWRWSLLLVVVADVIFFTVLVVYIRRDFFLKWAWSDHHGGLVNLGRKGRVLLLSPPDVDEDVSNSVCHLGSVLCGQGLDVSVDQWCRTQQSSLGPLLWLHSQLLKLNHLEHHVVIVLTQKAVEKTEEWAHQNKEVTPPMEQDKAQMESPYSDLFTASLCLLHADKQRGKAAEHFLLVMFDSSPVDGGKLPQLLQGLPVFQLPSQTQDFLTELRMKRTGWFSGRKSWTGWKWRGSGGWRAKIKEGAEQRKILLRNFSRDDTN